MKIARLDRRVTIKRVSETRDSFGGVAGGLVTVATVWARMVVEPGSESFNADRTVSMTPTVFEIRFRRDVSPKMVVVHRTTEFEIESVEEIERNETLRLTCHSRDAVSGS